MADPLQIPSASAPAAVRCTARALLLGERIDTAGLERSDVISTSPLAFRVGAAGYAVPPIMISKRPAVRRSPACCIRPQLDPKGTAGRNPPWSPSWQHNMASVSAPLLLHDDRRADLDPVIEIDHVLIGHANAAR